MLPQFFLREEGSEDQAQVTNHANGNAPSYHPRINNFEKLSKSFSVIVNTIYLSLQPSPKQSSTIGKTLTFKRN